MDAAHLFLLLFALLYLTQFGWNFALDGLNVGSLRSHQSQVPDFARDFISFGDYQKSIAYTFAKTKFGMLERIATATFLWMLILSGSFGWLDLWLSELVAPDTARLLYPLVIGLLLYGFSLPIAYLRHFRLEAAFGFNKRTPQTFVSDQLKGLTLALVLGLPLLWLFYTLVDQAGSLWWLYAFGVWTGVQFLMAALFPVFLAPLFYKLTPLEPGTLNERLKALAARIHFKMAGVYTMDGSRRSAHSNAFFAGFSKTRRVVLFDTLIQKLSEDEIVAVIAHEMGHDKKGHIKRQLLLSTVLSFVAFFALSRLLEWPLFYQAFGVQTPKASIGFVLFALFFGVVTFPLTPLFQAQSRKNEYEADALSVATTGDKTAMKQALKKLGRDNLSNLTPHPLYSFFHYSHPTLKERLDAIDKL